MDVYVVTQAEILGPELYCTVTKTKKEALAYIREQYPNAREDTIDSNYWSYLCKEPKSKHEFVLMFIRKESI